MSLDAPQQSGSHQADKLFGEALQLAPTERLAFLRRACDGDALLFEQLAGRLAIPAGVPTPEAEFDNSTRTIIRRGFVVGKTIAGRFRIVRFVGNGGMGDVYEAEDLLPSQPRRVALKTILAKIASQPDMIRQFEREIALGQMISHPNVCRIHDLGFHQDDPAEPPMLFLSMEFLDGVTLAQWLRDRKAMAAEEALPLIRQLAGALDAAHQVNIVHRDFKPGNIMLVKGRGSLATRAVVTDFGLATEVLRADANGVQSRSGAGTPDYMSPEQVKGEPVGPACDIYAFGVVVYQMLTGRLPFEGESALHRMAKRLHEPPVPPIAHFDSLPLPWNQAILRCLERDPADRFPSVQAAMAALDGAAQSITPPARMASRRPLLAYATIVLMGLALVAFGIRSLPRPASPSVGSIAVIPFDNVGADTEWQYLADGMTENMINRLSRIADLTVMSRSAVFRAKTPKVDPIEVGRKLHVEAVLTGSIRHDASHLEVSFELVDVATGRHLWGQKYRQDFLDPLTFEKSAVEDTATQLRSQLTPAEKRKVLRDYTENTNAFRLYLKGRYEWNKRNRKGYEQSIVFFRQALDIDPVYALAYSGLADAYAGQSDFLPPADVYAKAKAAAKRALEIDPDLPEAHTSLGIIYLQYEWDWAKAEAELQRAIQLNPNYPTAHSMHARLLSVLGRFAEAQTEITKAQKLDPLSMSIANGVGSTYYFSREFDRAETQYRTSLSLVNHPVTFSYLARNQIAAGRAGEAVKEYERLLAEDPGDVSTLVELSRAYALAGRRPDAERAYERARNSPRAGQPLPLTSLAGTNAALNRRDEAFAFLDQAFAERFWYLMFLKTDPLFDPLRGDPRYRALLRKMQLAD